MVEVVLGFVCETLAALYHALFEPTAFVNHMRRTLGGPHEII